MSDFHEMINGLILSDMSIERTSQIGARLCLGAKSKDFIKFVSNKIEKAGYICNDIAKHQTSESSCIKTKPHWFKMRTNSNADFSKLRNYWYPNGVKVVKSDLEMTPISLLYMYLGDGSLLGSASQPNTKGTVRLYTNGFDDESIFNLKKSIEELLGFKLKVYDAKPFGNKILVINGRNIDNFFKILPKCPKEIIKIFGYKWRDVLVFPRKKDWDNRV